MNDGRRCMARGVNEVDLLAPDRSGLVGRDIRTEIEEDLRAYTGTQGNSAGVSQKARASADRTNRRESKHGESGTSPPFP